MWVFLSRSRILRRSTRKKSFGIIALAHFEDVPSCIKEVLISLINKKRTRLMKNEMESMRVNQFWELLNFPKGKKAIGNKWVYTIKWLADGMPIQNKSRLATKEFTLQEGISYQETFSSIVCFASVRIISALVAGTDLQLYQMSAKTTLLNRELSEEIYMVQQKVLSFKGMKIKFLNWRGQFTTISSLYDNGIVTSTKQS